MSRHQWSDGEEGQEYDDGGEYMSEDQNHHEQQHGMEDYEGQGSFEHSGSSMGDQNLGYHGSAGKERSFELGELGDREIKKHLREVDARMQQQFQAAEIHQDSRIQAEQVKNAFYRNQLAQMQASERDNSDRNNESLTNSNTLPKNSNNNNNNNQFVSNSNHNAVSSQETSDNKDYQYDQNALRKMYEQQTRNAPIQYSFDVNKNNANLQQQLASNQIQSQQLHQLYKTADQQRQQLLTVNPQRTGGPAGQKTTTTTYLRNQENEQLQREIDIYRRLNQQEDVWRREAAAANENSELSKAPLESQEKQFQGQIERKFENQKLEKLLNSKQFQQTHYDSDAVARNNRKDAQLEELVRNVKQRVGSSLVMPKGNSKEAKLLNPQKLTLRQVESVEAEGRQGIIVRGPRDELDLKIFGTRRQCKECIFLLSKGLSSQYCPSCGQYKEKKHPCRVLPKRLSGM